MGRGIKGISIEFEGETKGLNKALGDVNKKSRDVQKELKGVNTLLKLDPSHTELVAQKQKLLKDAIGNTKEKLNRLKDAQKQVQEQFDKGEITEEQFRDFQREIVATEQKLKKLEKAGKKSMEEIGKGLVEAGDKMKNTGASMTRNVTAPILAAGAAGVALGADLKSAFDRIRVATGKTGKSLEGLKDDFREVAKDVPDSFEDISIAIGDLNTRLGLTGKPLQDLTKQLLTLARLTNADITALIPQLTRLFGDWSVETDSQSETLDKLFRVSQNMGIEVGTLAGLMTNFGSPLRQLGLDFDFTASMFARFEKEGVNIETVLPGLKMALKNFAQAGEEPAPALMKTFDAIKEAGSAADANKIAFEVFGARAGPDLAAAIREGRFELEELIQQAAEGEETILGAAEDTDDWREELSKLKNQIMIELEPTLIKLFDSINKMMPTIKKAAKQVVKLVEAFTELPQGVQTGILSFVGFLAAIGPILWVAGSLVGSIGRIAIGFSRISSVIGNAGGVVGMFTGIWAKLAGAFALVKGVISTIVGILTGPVGLTIALVAAVVAGGIFFDKLPTWAKYVVAIISPFSMVIGKIIEFYKKIQELGGIGEVWDRIKSATISGWNAVKNKLSEVWQSIKDFFAGLWQGAVDATTSAWDGVKTAVSNAWEAVKTAVSNAVTSIIAAIAAFPGQAIAFISDLFANKIPYWIGYGLGVMVLLVTGAIAAVVGFFAALPGRILGFLATAVDFIQQKWQEAKTWTAEAFTAMYNKVVETGAAIVASIQQKWQEAKTWVVESAIAIYDAVVTWFSQLPGRILGFLASMVNFISEKFNQAKSTAMSISSALISAVVNFFSSLPGKIASFIASIPGTLQKTFQTARDNAVRVLVTLLDYIRSLPGKVLSIASNIGRALWDGLTKWFDKVKQGFKDALDLKLKLSPSVIDIFSTGLDALIREAKRLYEIPELALSARYQMMPALALDTTGAASTTKQVMIERTIERSGQGELHLHIGALIADDLGIKQLENTLREFRTEENARKGQT